MMRHYARSRSTRVRAPHRRANDAGNILWRALGEAFPFAGFRRQVPFGPHIVDFASFPARLIIEIVGSGPEDAAGWDPARTRFLATQGYWVLRVRSDEILADLDGVLEAIVENLPLPSPSPAAGQRGTFPLPVGEGFMEN